MPKAPPEIIRSPTSASNFFRRVLCPGSEAMEKDLPDIEDEYSVEGTLLHRHVADKTLPRNKLTHEQLDVLEVAEKLENELVQHFWGLPVEVKREFEVRLLGMRSHPDLQITSPRVSRLTLADFKFGRKAVAPAELNWQILVYLVGIHWKDRMQPDVGSRKYVGAIIQPWVSRGIESVIYMSEQLDAAHEKIESVLKACHAPDAPRIPSHEACLLCKGRLHGACPEVRNMALEPLGDANLIEAVKLNPVRFLKTLAPAKRSQLLDALDFAEDLRTIIRDAARFMLREDAASIPGFALGKAGKTSRVTDMNELWSRLEKLGLEQGKFRDLCSISNKDVESVLRDLTKEKGDALKARVKEVLAGTVDTYPTARKLLRKGDPDE